MYHVASDVTELTKVEDGVKFAIWSDISSF